MLTVIAVVSFTVGFWGAVGAFCGLTLAEQVEAAIYNWRHAR